MSPWILPVRNRTKHVWSFWRELVRSSRQRLERTSGRQRADPQALLKLLVRPLLRKTSVLEGGLCDNTHASGYSMQHPFDDPPVALM